MSVTSTTKDQYPWLGEIRIYKAMTKKTIIISGLLGSGLEWAEYTYYAYMVVVFAKLFFPSDNQTIATIATFAIFAVGYLMRPLGAVVLSHIGDKYGRKIALSLSMMLMGIATLGIGLLPTYQTIGIAAPVILVIFRLLQGFAVAGELNGAAIFLIEHDNYQRPYLTGSLVGMSAALGTVIGSLAAVIVSSNTMPSWSWRIPFLLGSCCCIISLYIRLKLQETPSFRQAQQNNIISKLPLIELVKQNKNSILTTLILAAFVAVTFYICNVYFVTFLVQQGHFSHSQASTITMLGQLTAVLLYPIIGYLADKFTGSKIMLLGFMLMPIAALLNYHNGQFSLLYPIILAQLLYALSNALAIAPLFFYLHKLFATTTRYSGNTIPWCISAAIFGGTAPTLAHVGVHAGYSYFPAIYLTIISLISFLTVLKKQSQLRKRQHFSEFGY